MMVVETYPEELAGDVIKMMNEGDLEYLGDMEWYQHNYLFGNKYPMTIRYSGFFLSETNLFYVMIFPSD